MKKFVLSLALTICWASAQAQLSSPTLHRERTHADNTFAPQKRSEGQRKGLTPVTTTPVYKQPEGTVVYASRDAIGFSPYGSYLLSWPSSARGIRYVNQGDTVIWIPNPISQYRDTEQGWLKLDFNTERNGYRYYWCHTPQAITVRTNTETGVKNTYYVTRMTGNTSSQNYTVASNLDISFRMDENGVLTQTNGTKGNELIGLTDAEGNWYGYGDYGFVATSNYDTPVSVPQNMETSRYIWACKTNAEGTSSYDQFVSVGYDGDTVYISNPVDTTQFFRGIIRGDKCYVKSPQYMGLSENNGYLFYIYATTFRWTASTAYETTLIKDTIVLDYDPVAQRFSVPKGHALVATVNDADSLYNTLSPDVIITSWQERAATPTAPYFWKPEDNFHNYNYYTNYKMGFGYTTAVFSTHDTEGVYLDPEKMYYRMFIDDDKQPFVFDNIDYPDLPEEEMTEIPHSYSDGYIAAYTNIVRQIYFLTNVADSIGFQSIYKGGGETRYSDIAWYKPEKTVDSEQGNISSWEDENTLLYSAYNSGKTNSWGTHKQENYGVAVRVKDENLVGMTIEKVRIPFGNDVTGLSNGRVFLTKDLKVKNSENKADIAVQHFDIQSGWVEVTLDEPYQLTSEGVYVGFLFNEDEFVDSPLEIVTNNTGSGNLYMLSTRTYRHWFDVSANTTWATAMQVVMTGSVAHAASVTFDGLTTQLGEKPQVGLTIINHGSQPIQSIDWTYTEGSFSNTIHTDFSKEIKAQYGATAQLNLTLPEQAEEGNQTLTVTINKVNGADNGDASPSHSAIIKVYSFLPTYRPLMEEYTGTGCGYCPRGLVGLDKMLDIYGDDFIAVSYHQYNSSDAMYFDEKMSNNVTGFPAAFFNRNHSTDAYYGDANNNVFGLDKTFEAVRKDVIAPADVWAEAAYIDEDLKLQATAYATFPLPDDEAHYAFVLIVIANNLSGTGAGWFQTNYYKGDTSADADLKAYVYGTDPYTKQVYNFVALAWANNTYIKNSLPTEIEGGKTYEYTMDFNLANKAGIIKDKEDVQVVVALIDTTDGHVVNANKANVRMSGVGIESTSESSNAHSASAVYDLSGRRLSAPQKGVNIIRNANGTVSKVLNR